MLKTSEVRKIEANPEPVKMGAEEVQEKPLYEEKSMDEWQNALLKVLEEPQSPDSLGGGVCDVKMEKDTESFNISDDIFGSSIEFEECEKMPISEEDSGSSSSGSGDEIKKEQDYSSTESNRESDSFCAGLNIDIDKMEMDSGFENLDMDFDFSDLDIDPTILSDNRGTESLDLSNFCMDELQEKDLAEEEALLLAVVSKAESQQQKIQEHDQDFSSCNSTTTTNVDEFSSGQKKSRTQKSSSRSPPPGKRKVKVDWTPDLHRRFVQAVEQLGVDKAVPSRILELMGVTCLTRHNIASHLQKYRSHRKHLLAREAEAATWNQRRQLYTIPGAGRRGLIGSHNSSGRSPVIHPRPAIGYPSVPQQAPAPPPQVAYRAPLHVWGHPTVDHSMFRMWHKPGFSPHWPPQPLTTQTAPAPRSHLYPHPPLSSPMVPVPGCIPPPYSSDYTKSLANTNSHPPKEEVDAAISEVLKNPWTPLPIGLNPPSLEGVMTELQRQGVPSLPPASATS